MKTLNFLTAFLLFGFCSCGQEVEKQKVDPAAVQLNNQAMALVAFINDPDSSKKAIFLLDQATAIDSNYFLGYYHKLMFYNAHEQFEKAFSIVNRLIRLRPGAHDLYQMGGILKEKMGDTIASRPYFENSLAICNKVLDTMKTTNQDYVMLVCNKAINLIFLGNQAGGNQLLKRLFDTQTEELYKEWIVSLMNKNKKQLLEFLFDSQYAQSEASVEVDTPD